MDQQTTQIIIRIELLQNGLTVVLELEGLQDAGYVGLISCEVLGEFPNLSELSLSHIQNGDHTITS